MSNKSYKFTLKNIDKVAIQKKYSIFQGSAPDDFTVNFKTEDVVERTELSDLMGNAAKSVSFVDASKKLHVCTVSSIDFKKRGKYHCFWDRHIIPSEITPLGVPIKYVSSKARKIYYSEISRDTYTITEYITKKKLHIFEKGIDDRIEVTTGGFYETMDIVCSWNCMLSLIEHNHSDPMYKDSKALFHKLYRDVNDGEECQINPAPHWRNLSIYGGHLSIKDFRNGLDSIVYEPHGCTKNLPLYRPIGLLYEKCIKF